jgi:S1-C subfamily serine protease
MYAAEAGGQIVVGGLAKDAPADRAGIRPGDMVLEVAGRRVSSLADLFRRIWALGAAGAEIPLTLAREGSLLKVRLQSVDRNDFLKKPSLH